MRRICEVGVAGWPLTGGVLNITEAVWTAGFQRWHSGEIMRMQNVSEYMLVLAVCLVYFTVQHCRMIRAVNVRLKACEWDSSLICYRR